MAKEGRELQDAPLSAPAARTTPDGLDERSVSRRVDQLRLRAAPSRPQVCPEFARFGLRVLPQSFASALTPSRPQSFTSALTPSRPKFARSLHAFELCVLPQSFTSALARMIAAAVEASACRRRIAARNLRAPRHRRASERASALPLGLGPCQDRHASAAPTNNASSQELTHEH